MGYEYANGVLGLRSKDRFLPLTDFTRNQNTPLYLYDREDILKRVGWYQKAFSRPVKIHFAMKANSMPELLKLLAQTTLGADVVSGGELQRALECGFPPERIVFSGVGKSTEELILAIRNKIGQINMESLPEIERLADLTKNLDQPIPVGIRLNPDVRADTHLHITTGMKENKFGLDFEALPKALDLLKSSPGMRLQGLAMHVGSQILETSSILEATTRIKAVFEDLRRAGWPLQSLDLGGGLGLDYLRSCDQEDQARLAGYAQKIEAALGSLECEVLLEPGRFLVARSGVLLTQVEYVKETPHRNFIIVNAGMNHFLRPALYQAEHRILPVIQSQGTAATYDIVGPICESTDVLGRQRTFSNPRSGDWLALMDAGAYGFSLANQYNLRELPRQILL